MKNIHTVDNASRSYERIAAGILGMILAVGCVLLGIVGFDIKYQAEYGPHQIEVLTDAMTRTTWRVSFNTLVNESGYECIGADVRWVGGQAYLTFIRAPIAVAVEDQPELAVTRSLEMSGEAFVEFLLPEDIILDGGELELIVEGRGRSQSQGTCYLPPASAEKGLNF